MAARASQPFRGVAAFVPSTFSEWEGEQFAGRELTTIFVALAPDGTWVGVVTGLHWPFTGTHPGVFGISPRKGIFQYFGGDTSLACTNYAGNH
jgi:hypothetical protein